MKRNTDIDTIKFVINEVKKICQSKNFKEGLSVCNSLDYFITNMKQGQDSSLDRVILIVNVMMDELNFLIDIEKRYILFPLPDIKKEAYEIGKRYTKNFIEWVKPDDSPEKLMEILEEEIHKLAEMRKILKELSE